MTPKRFLVLLLICFYSLAWCQVMNIRNWRKTEKDSLENSLQWLEEKKFSLALPILENIFENHPDEDYLKYTIAKCDLSKPEKHEEAYRLLSAIYQKNKKIPDIQYYLAQAAYYNYNFDEALTNISSFALNKHISPEAKKNAENLKTLISYARYYYTHPGGAKADNIGSVINTEGDEFGPILTEDQSQMIYNYTGIKSTGGKQNNTWQKDEKGNYYPDIYCSIKQEGDFTEPFVVKNINGRGPDIALSLSHDGRVLFIYRYNDEGRGDIYQCDLAGHEFSKPYKLKGAVNSGSWEGSCSLSPDGKTLYFISDRPGGKGGKDIYRASLAQDSSWTNIINLGDSVNTPFDEESPFMHADGKTLFYSSKGRTTSGGFDIFKSVMRKDSLFKKAENLGYPINSPGDDVFFVLSANGENAYLSSDRKEGKGFRDIYHVEPHFKGPKPSLCLLKGSVSKDNKPFSVEIKVEISTKNNHLYSKLYSNAGSGNYLLTLPTGEAYKLTYTPKNFETKTFQVDLTDMVGYVEKIKNIEFASVNDSLKNQIKTEVVSQKTMSVPAPTNAVVVNTPTIPVKQVSVKEHTLTSLQTTLTLKEEPKEVIGQQTQSNVHEIKNAKESGDTSANSKNLQAAENKTLKITETKTLSINPKSVIKDSMTTTSKKMDPAIRTASVAPSKQLAAKDTLKAIITASADTKQKMGVVNLKKEESKIKTDSVKTLPKTVSETAKNLKKDTVIPNKPMAKTTSTPSLPKKVIINDFTPHTKGHEKMKLYAQNYGLIELSDLTFKAQISAFKGNGEYSYPKLNKLGKIEELHLNDGYTRLMIGGTFKNYITAFDFVRKVISAGHDDVYIVAIYKGERYSIEDLEAVGIFR